MGAFIITSVIFGLYFSYIGLWYLIIIPILLCLILARYFNYELPTHIKDQVQRQELWLPLAWICVNIGLVSLANYIGFDQINIALILVWLNSVCMISSFFLAYKDGEYVFQIWYYGAILYTIISSLFTATFGQRLDIVSILWAYNIGIFWFIIGINGIIHKIPSYLYYKAAVLIAWWWAIVILQYTDFSDIGLLIVSIGLTLIATALRKIGEYKPITTKVKKEISVRQILAGKKISNNTYIPEENQRLAVISHYIQEMPSRTRMTLQAANIIIIFSGILMYVNHVTQDTTHVQHWIFRGIIICFIATNIILKYMSIQSIVQKIALYLVVNFAIYVTLFILFGQDIGTIAARWVIWNLSSGLLIFYGPESPIANILKKQDYTIWIAMTIVACIWNIVLMSKTSMPAQLTFSLAFVYMGIQGMILYYGISHIQKME